MTNEKITSKRSLNLETQATKQKSYKRKLLRTLRYQSAVKELIKLLRRMHLSLNNYLLNQISVKRSRPDLKLVFRLRETR